METTALSMFNQTVKYQGNDIWIKPVCDFFKLHAKNQYTKIKNDPILGNLVGKNRPDLGKIDQNGRIFLSKKGFVRWIQIINPKTVRDELRQNFIQFQELIFDYLFGSAQEQDKAKLNYARLQKLERLKGKINNEIKQVRRELRQHWSNRYFQTKIRFNELEPG